MLIELSKRALFLEILLQNLIDLDLFLLLWGFADYIRDDGCICFSYLLERGTSAIAFYDTLPAAYSFYNIIIDIE